MATILGLQPPECAYADAYRTLRTALLATHARDPFRSLLISSAQPAEGKTSVALNLSSTLARGQKRVLLVDADLLRPSLHALLGVPPTAVGFVDACRGHVEPAAAVHDTNLPGLSVMTVGHDIAGSSDIPGLPSTREVIRELGRTFDFVIADSAPLLVHSATLELAASMDAVLLVARARGRAPTVRRAITSLQEIGAKLLGVVVNDVLPEDQAAEGVPYYHYYRYGGESTTPSDTTS